MGPRENGFTSDNREGSHGGRQKLWFTPRGRQRELSRKSLWVGSKTEGTVVKYEKLVGQRRGRLWRKTANEAEQSSFPTYNL